MTLVRQAAGLAPEMPAVLWYTGVEAVRASRRVKAKRYWTRLLTKLPSEGDDTYMVRSALRSLGGG